MRDKKAADTDTAVAKERQLFEYDPVPKALLTLILPTIVSQIVHVFYNMADTWFLGLTENAGAVAALSVCMPLYSFMTCISNLFGLGGAGVISRHLGTKDYRNIKKAFASAFWGTLLAALLVSAAMLIFGKPFLMLIGADNDSISYAVQYALVTVTIGSFPTILSAMLSHLVRALGESGKAGFGLTIGSLLNLGLDPLFMFVILPQGNEVLGAAIATLLSNVVSLVYFMMVLFGMRKTNMVSLHPAQLKGAGRISREIVVNGCPSFFMMLMPQISVSMVNSFVADIGGSAAVAGMGITRKIDSLAFSVNQGITQGVLSFIAYNYSAGKTGRMKQAIKLAAVSSVLFSVCTSTISLLIPQGLITLFIRDPQTIRYGASFLRILCLSIPIYSVTYIVIATYQAVGKVGVPILLSLRRGVLDTCFFFGISALAGEQYFLWGSPIAETIAMLIAVFLLRKLLRSIEHQI